MHKTSSINSVRRALQDGSVVLLPTETVYGLVADAKNNAATEALYALKGRDFNKPIAICVRASKAAKALVHWSETAQRLTDHFWPGPLSIVLPAKDELGLDARLFGQFSDGSPSLSLRCPDTPWRGHLDVDYLALTSANRSGEADTKDFKTAHNIFGPQIGASYDGGTSPIGVPSTIIAIENERVRLLRAGALTADDFAPLALDWISS